MAMVILNGRRTQLPDSVSDADIRRAGNIDPARNVIHRQREGNFIVPRGAKMQVRDGDVFLDAPARIKGRLAGEAS